MPTTNTLTNALVTERREVHSELVFLKIAPDGWQMEPFAAGQFAVLGLPGKAPRCENSEPDVQPVDQDKLIRRAYSIGSNPTETDELEFYISLVASGGLSPRLLALQEGDRVHMAPKVKGSFTLEGIPADQNLVLISTGTGLTPYVSMLRGPALKSPRKVAVFQGVRHSWDLGYNQIMSDLQSAHGNLTYQSTVSRAHLEKEPWEGNKGHVQELWKAGILEQHWGFLPKPENTHVFLCGNPSMIEGAQELLEKEGFTPHSKSKPGNIHVEKYW